jgi:2-deoxy-D-gluconate 3-dehydrogenase
VIETNLTSVFRWSQDAAKEMMKSGGGKIINIASVLSFSGGVNVAAYAAAKGGVSQLTKALANEWAKHGINVNAIAPGYFETDATSALRKNPERSAQILSRIPAGRFGEPNELAGAFIFLASHASDYMHGHILTVDGGFNSF